jgi:CheY-like chemotaxis protein
VRNRDRLIATSPLHVLPLFACNERLTTNTERLSLLTNNKGHDTLRGPAVAVFTASRFVDDTRILVGDIGVNPSPRVLIVDRSPESREVLRTILELRGASTLETDQPERACLLAAAFRPDLIVLDADSEPSGTHDATDDLREAAGRMATPIVILGTLRRVCGQLPAGQILAKPYHYGTLIRRIDDLLAAA